MVQTYDRKKEVGLLECRCYDDLLCDDDAFHPRVDRAVVMVGARNSERERIRSTVPEVR